MMRTTHRSSTVRTVAAVAVLVIVAAALSACAAPGASSNASDLAERLDGLAFDEFLRVSWGALYLRDPERVVADGLGRAYGLEGDELTDISAGYHEETYDMCGLILGKLQEYDREALSPDQQVSYDVYEWYLDDHIRGEEFMHYDYPATFFSPTAVQFDLVSFFTDLHPLATREDAENYVARLGKVKTKLNQLVGELRTQEREGIVPPRFAVEWTMPGVYPLAHGEPDTSPFYTAFRDKLADLHLGDSAEQELLDDALRAVRQSVMPGYAALERQLEHQLSVAPSDVGVWQFPKGQEYYAYLLRHYTTTELTAGEIHQLGLAELERIQAELRTAFDELGYPADESLPELFDRVEADGGFIAANDVIPTYDRLVRQAEARLSQAFITLPRAQVVVLRSPIQGMYTAPSVDGSRPGAFHAGLGNRPEAYFAMPTLTYHETVPGHHLQISLAAEADLPLFRNMTTFLGYTEGWALYAEQLAAELGWYDDDPYGNLGRLQAEAFRAARLVVDTGIHHDGWSFDEAVDFFREATGFEDGDSVSPTDQVARYVVWPGQATAYKVGMIRILELRQEAMAQLGTGFDLREFHQALLQNGSMPLEVLEDVVDTYVQQHR